MPAPFGILFLCTGNSARSILAEAIANQMGAGTLRAWSAGSQPKGAVHPQALRLLRQLDHPVEGLRSKGWDEFAAPGAPALDFIVTVCDSAASETCPVWPGMPVTAHWGLPDPAAVRGSETEIALAFSETYRALHRRIGLLLALPLASLDSLSVQRRMDAIGSPLAEPAS